MGDDDASNLAFDETSQPMEVDEPSLVINTEDECYCQSERCQGFNLSQQLDAILDPGLIFSSPNQPERLWTILAHGYQDSAAYIEKLNEYRIESHCGLAWPPGYVAYRCRTCSVALTMSLCAECFRAGNHEGHDYNMFKSRSGGACDCGYSIMKSSGHCSNHGRNAKAPRSNEPIPVSLTCLASRAIPRMISRLVIQLRRQAVGRTMETDIYLDCLTQIANSSAILRNLMIQVIISGDAYSSQARLLSHHPDSRVSKIVRESQKILKRERKKLVAFKVPSSWPTTVRNVNAFCDKAPHKTFLEELVFWMVVYEFHQKLVCFLLGFLMDNNYKEIFSRLFVNYYPNIAVCLTSSPTDPRRHLQDSFEHLSRRILQVSVQIYNDGDLTRNICEEEMTLHTLIYCLRIMIEGSQSDGIFSALKSNPLCQHNSNAPKVVCCDNSILRDRQLTSFTEDLLAILSFDHESKRLLSDTNLLQVWLEFLSYFQTMSPYKRELNEHAPYETGPRQSVFMIESEFCLVPLWTILSHLKDTSSIAHTSQLLESIHANLANWLYKMSIGPHSKLDTYFMSFHIPLHRMLAATIRHMIYEQKVSEEDVFNLLCKNQSVFGAKFSYRSAHGARVTIKIEDFMRMLLLHPLQALTLYHQTRSGMWTRNGILTVNQAITYVHCAYCYSIIDMDMFLLRYCASRMKADTFLKSLLQKFYAWHCLSFTCGPIFSDTPSDTLKVHYYFNIQPEQITQMVESCLVTLIQLLTLGNHCNLSNREQTKQEMIGLISVADRSYSYLVDMLPNITEQHRDEETFASLLDELTVYKPASHGAGGSLQQGCYTLKPKVWENDYNPIHVLHRYYQRRDYQQSLDRFFQHAKSVGKLNRRSHSSALWPPLRIPEKVANFGPIDLSPVVTCQTLLGVVFSILYKCIYVEEMPDLMMAYTIHLLELALRKQQEASSVGADNDDKMDHDQEPSESEPMKSARNPSFVGKYSYRELISYYENMPKDEALLKGRTIYSLFAEEPNGLDPKLNVKLFPFVKHALDLAFDTTWFPFSSVIDNCLVHIETVHSLPREEFDAMIQCAYNERNENETATFEESLYASASSERSSSEQNFPDMSATSSTRSTESQTGTWSNLIGLEVEEVDDIEIEVDEDDGNEDDDDELDFRAGLNVDDLNEADEETDEVGDTSELELSSLNQLSASETTSPFTSSPSVGLAPSVASGASTSLTTATATPPVRPTIGYVRDSSGTSWATHGNFRVALATPQTEPDHNRRRDLNIQGYLRMNEYMDAVARLEGALNRADQQNLASGNSASTIIHHDRVTLTRLTQLAEARLPVPPLPPASSNEHLRQISPQQQQQQQQLQQQQQQQDQQQQQQPVQAQNLITERRAILDSPPRGMITNPDQPLALEAASLSGGASNTTSASTSTTNQALQQAHRSRRPPDELSTFNQNLTSSGGAIVPRPIGELTANSTDSRQQEAPNQIDRSLSEIDIQARFMGFFQSDASPSPRINPGRVIRPRQTARRGNYRGAYLIEPYLPYTPPNNNNNNTTTNNNNNNNNETVQELVRRSVAVVPAITDAVRSTIQQQTAQRVENLATGARAAASVAGATTASQATREEGAAAADGSPRSSSPSPPPSPTPLAAGERIVTTPRHQVAVRSNHSGSGSGWGRQPGTTLHMVNRFITTRSKQIQQDQRSRRLRKEHRQHHGESILTLLLRLHAKYSQQPRSYHYDEHRAKTNLDPNERSRIGDGAHFVSIALDLICVSDDQIRQRVDYLRELIWPKPANEKAPGERGLGVVVGAGSVEGNEKGLRGEKSAANGSDDIEMDAKTSLAPSTRSNCAAAATDMRAGPPVGGTPASAFGSNLAGGSMKLNASSSGSNPIALLTPEEKRHRAKERQTRLMAEFANKQRAFMEKYTASTSKATPSAAGRSGCLSGPAAAAAATSSATLAHNLGPVANAAASGSQPYSNLTLQASDKEPQGVGADLESHGCYEEQPINLSSKSNQEQASRSQSVSAADNNGGRAGHESAAVYDSSHNDQPQLTSAAATSATGDKDIINTTTTTTTSGLASSGIGEQQQQQQPSSLNENKEDQQTSSVDPVFGSATAETADTADDGGLQYECCICGVEGLSESTNPLGQVVLLQSTSVYGHSHLRPQSERKLPCDEADHLSLKEETYAKYLEHRIDTLCDQFAESSWLDSINIGAEGGVHVQSCGHHLHIECHQSYIRSLDQEDGLRARNDSDEFQCPVCRQLANSVLPILNDDFFLDTNRTRTARAFSSPPSKSWRAKAEAEAVATPTAEATAAAETLTELLHMDDPHGRRQTQNANCYDYEDDSAGPKGRHQSSSPFPQAEASDSTALATSQTLDDQIAQVGLQLQTRRTPNQRELQSSATFCSHLTKATGPQYRLIRTNASMHSLFLFLSSIVRTNLETSLIARSIKSQIHHQEKAALAASSAPNPPALADSNPSNSYQQQQHCSPPFQTMTERGKGKRTCFQLLFHVLALNAQTLINNQWCTYDHVWSHLTHRISEANRLSIRPRNSEVPLLLRDPVAMLLQFLFTVSGSKSHERAHFTCLVKILFNLTVIQSTALVLSYVRSVPKLEDDCESPRQSPMKSSTEPSATKTPRQLDRSWDPTLKRNKQQQYDGASPQATNATEAEDDNNNQQLMNLESLLWSVWTNLGPLLARTKEEPLMNSVVRSSWPRLAGQLEQDLWCNDEREGQQQQQQQQQHCHQEGGRALDERTNRAKKLKFIENRIKLACLPFLRAAAFLQEHLYGVQGPNLICELNEQRFSDPGSVDQDFSQLVRCLELWPTNLSAPQLSGQRRRATTEEPPRAAGVVGVVATAANIKYESNEETFSSPITLHQTLNWPSSAGSMGQDLVASWATELLQFAKERSIAARTLLLSRPLAWYRPGLMQLPHAFDDIFMFYYRRKCSLCQQVPKDVAVCLVCGAPICFRASCCKDRSRSRQVHSQHCGANTAVFLAVHTSAVVVIRGNRACVWGSVYLDAHDEEDNGLQRGKPLYMVPARFALLETQWLTHSFDHTCGKRWIWLQEAQ